MALIKNEFKPYLYSAFMAYTYSILVLFSPIQ
jgi:hypothetical protein